MQKLIIFDLDGTLADLAKPILDTTIKQLNTLMDMGHTIAVCSGKPTYYLCGMLRQTGIVRPVYIGENGATIQFGVDLPPKQLYKYPYSERARTQIHAISEIINKRCGDNIWCQPNEVVYTPFPRDRATFAVIRDIISTHRTALDAVTIYEHGDCFDFIPKEVNKQNGVKYLAELLKVNQRDIIAVGDGVNDYSMFAYANESFGINIADSTQATHNMTSINEVLDYIINNYNTKG